MRGPALPFVWLALCIPLLASAMDSRPGAKLWVVPLSTKVSQGDDMRAFVFIQNTGSSTLRVPMDFGSRLLYEVTLPDGSTDKCAGAVREDFVGMADDTILLPPNAVFGSSVDYPVTSEPGRWRLRASFTSPTSQFADMIVGIYKSPWIRYTVLGPSSGSPNSALHAPGAADGQR